MSPVQGSTDHLLVQLREMLPFDLWQVMKIDRDSFSLPWSESSFLKELNDPCSVSLVATIRNREIVGYVCASQVEDEGEIKTIAVRRDMRSKGIGSLLVENVLERLRLRGCRRVFLEVRVSNTIARRLYQKFGFRTVGVRHQYYLKPQEDALVMMRELYSK